MQVPQSQPPEFNLTEYHSHLLGHIVLWYQQDSTLASHPPTTAPLCIY